MYIAFQMLSQVHLTGLGMQATLRIIPASGTFFHKDLVMKIFYDYSSFSADS